MLIALIVVAALTKAPLEETASRDAAGFTPRPEWYFLWLFQLLKYFKGSFEASAPSWCRRCSSCSFSPSRSSTGARQDEGSSGARAR